MDESKGTGQPSDRLPDDAPDGLRAAANGQSLGEPGDVDAQKAERGALEFLLGRTRRPEYDVDVGFDTPAGELPLTFHIFSVDGKRITELENEHRSETTGKFDDIAFNAALVYEAMVPAKPGDDEGYFEDATGRRVTPSSPEFRGAPDMPGPVALQQRFKYQDGLLAAVAEEVRRLGGWSPSRLKGTRRASAGERREPAAANPSPQRSSEPSRTS